MSLKTKFFKQIFLFIIIPLALLPGCNLNDQPINAQITYPFSYNFPYDLTSPDYSAKLKNDLVEISGLTYSSKDKALLAINDEEGKVYFLQPQTGEILKKHKFGKGADYEGIEMVDSIIYVVKSNGTIVSFEYPGEEKENQSYPNALTTDNDVEGLGYDPVSQQLLLACKKKAGIDKSLPRQRAIYTFDLSNHELNETPQFTISKDSLKTIFQQGAGATNKFMEFFVPDQIPGAIAPSGIAVHPFSKHYYIISALGKLLIVTNEAGDLLYATKLDKDQYPQPEGICFDELGNLYLSTEGRGRKAKLFSYKIKQ